ncbi:hypothetical protein HMSSN036_42360 [Paenibacillus macerans]|nr:hypothetical protein HMSSN036_42360 [Paenibacillus macerans]
MSGLTGVSATLRTPAGKKNAWEVLKMDKQTDDGVRTEIGKIVTNSAEKTDSAAAPDIKVSMFITCISDAVYPRIGEAMARLLARLGVKLEFPAKQTCCGQPAFNSGYWDEARKSAATLLEAFADSDFVIAPSGSCIGMIHHYPKLFENDPVRLAMARELQNKSYEFTQFLVQVLGVADLGAVFPHKVTYHPSCHAAGCWASRTNRWRCCKTSGNWIWFRFRSRRIAAASAERLQ